jgi:hypothetical protein
MLIARTIGIQTGFIYEGENYKELRETTHCDEDNSAPKELWHSTDVAPTLMRLSCWRHKHMLVRECTYLSEK